MADTRIHPETGATLRRDVRPFAVEYRGRRRVVSLPGWYPAGEGDALHTGKDTDVADAALSELKTEVRRENAAYVASVRKKLGLSQRQAGELIGGGPRAFQKYESGEVEPSEAMLKLLRLLDNDPSRIAELQPV
ncbi:type II toxin-antitoxin system MqsA family antitoxin [Parvibaculum sp.]|jgi:HTH-type transcriptional regulator/antitoxin MqsA|uniref:type II toxin-antitoxin system MqsA family antitoxin n=1 Tax=Parvibaculum sp. TaxID=2024848 RepID=UPI002FDA0095